MKIPHSFIHSDTAQEELLTGEVVACCEVCCYPEEHFNHRAPENLSGLLGELFDFVVDQVSIGKIPAPPNGLLSRCTKVLSR